MYYTSFGCCVRKLLICRSFFCLIVILGGFHSLLCLLASVVSFKARLKKNLVMVIHEAILSGALPFLRGKVHGFFYKQLKNGVRHLTTHHTHPSVLSSVLKTLKMLLQARQVSAYSILIPARYLLQVASCHKVLSHCLNLLIIFCGCSGPLVFLFARCL